MKFTKQQWMLAAIFLAAFVFHIGSLCFLIRHFGASSVSEIGNGFVTIYWGGDKPERDLAIYNANEWPVRRETHYAGAEALPNGMKWEMEGPNVELSFVPNSMRYRGFFRALGYTLPQLRGEDGAVSFLLPVGSLTLVVELGALFFITRSFLSCKTPHQV